MTQMMKSRWAGLVMLFVLCAMPMLTARKAEAADNAFYLINNTGFAIYNVQVYEHNNGDAGAKAKDLLGEGVIIPNGGKVAIYPEGGKGVTQWTMVFGDKDDKWYGFSPFRLAEIAEIKLFYKDGVCKAFADNGQRFESTATE